MTRPTDRDLLAWLTRSLSPARASEIDHEVHASAELQLRVRELSARLGEGARSTPAWRVPPPGFGAMRAVATSAVLGALAPGGLVTARLELPPELEARVLVVLLRTDGEWRVVHPASPEDALRIGELPKDRGEVVVDLVAPPTPGTHRFGIALPEGPIDWSLPIASRWGSLREGIAAGAVPVTTFDVTVG